MGRVSYSLKLRIFFFDRVKGTLEFRISDWDTGISINTLRSISIVLPYPYLFLRPGKGYPRVPDILLGSGYLNIYPP